MLSGLSTLSLLSASACRPGTLGTFLRAPAERTLQQSKSPVSIPQEFPVVAVLVAADRLLTLSQALLSLGLFYLILRTTPWGRYDYHPYLQERKQAERGQERAHLHTASCLWEDSAPSTPSSSSWRFLALLFKSYPSPWGVLLSSSTAPIHSSTCFLWEVSLEVTHVVCA